MKIDVIIPTYKPGKEFEKLIGRLQKQEYPIHKIIIINTRTDIFPEELDRSNYKIEITHIEPDQFDHGGTRNMGAGMSDADIVVYMTQDAIPVDEKLIGTFAKIFEENPDIGIAYGRQLPREECNIIERYTRRFNYPEKSFIKTKEDLPKLGIKTFFCSDVCAAYRRNYLLSAGGFENPTIFNEDMIFAGKRIYAGDKVAYVAEAKVIHSHNYTGRQQFHRNFDLAVSQAQHPEVFEGVPSEGEGIRMVKATAKYLVRNGYSWKVFMLVYQSGCKYIGYFLGKRYEKLPMWLILKCTSSRKYWKNS
ncbi:glycosyltransferase family 2 protein [Dorea formicigenerans]|uniref:Glycosyltransferase n=1 Tax=Dorea formicigenerans TaxID=39486 RepID=A0A413YPW0_9FIRM|nr:glycosyltransferase family A protein [Dorea formicigenerans]RHC11091.1 glycosyltransferase [Dorea formicigenerans]RHC24090.1 glycosyltransferase [Dorea formicigenerans]